MTNGKEIEQTIAQEKPAEPSALGKRSLKNRRRRKVLGIVLAGIAVLIAAVAVPGWLHMAAHESTDDAFINGRIVSVSPRVSGHVAKVYVRDNQQVNAGDPLLDLDDRDFRARLDAARADLHAEEASGRYRAIDVNLTAINTSAVLEESKAGVHAAIAMVENALAMVDTARSRKQEARAQLDYAGTALEQAKAAQTASEAKYRQSAADLKRYQELAAKNTISPQQLDHAVTAERMAAADLAAANSQVATQASLVAKAKAALKTAEDSVRQAVAQVEARQGQLEQANARLSSSKSGPEQVAQSNSQVEKSNAEIEKARVDVERAALNLSYTKISAPIDGYITKKSAEPGAFVQVGQSLMAIVSSEVWVTANFKETQLTNMRAGQPVTISVDTYPDKTFHGHVDSIQRGTGSRFSLLPPENATGNFVKVVQRIPVKIVFDRPEELAGCLLVPGMSVIPEVSIKESVPPGGETASDIRVTNAAGARP